MPDTPWWSQPGATAPLPEQTYQAPPSPPYPPYPAVSDATPHKRRSVALLLALALVVGGGVGGAVASALDNRNGSSASTVSSFNRSTGTIVAASLTGSPEAAAATIGPSVVTVEVSGSQAGFGGSQQSVSGTGSGIVLRTDGYILTNNHVVSAATSGGTVAVTLSDGKTVPAKIVGTDPTSDLAVIKIDGVAGLKAATFADSNTLKVGQTVLAVGAPLGLSNTVTLGIVSTLNRPVRTGEPGASAQAVLDAIQTDAAINPGNSGGALVDLAGRVVGVNSAIATAGSGNTGNIGVGFAIPANAAQEVAQEIISTGRATHAQIGVSVRDAGSRTAGAPGVGATLTAVGAGGPAAQAGLQPGDIVTSVGDRRVTDADSLIVAVRANNPGTKVPVTYTRGGASRSTNVTLATAS